MNIRAMKVGATYAASSKVSGRYQDAFDGVTFKVKVLSIGDTYTTRGEFGGYGRQQRGVTVEILETIRQTRWDDTPEEAEAREPKKVRLPGMYDAVTIEKGNTVVIGGRGIFATGEEYDARIEKQKKWREKQDAEFEERQEKKRAIVRWMRDNGLTEWQKEDAGEWREDELDTHLPYIGSNTEAWEAFIDALDREPVTA
jgi:hypothetical protein